MIGVGINENVVLDKATMDDKGRLALSFREKGVGGANVFDALTTAGVSEDETFTLRLFPFNVPNIPGKELTDLEKSEIVVNDMTKLKNQLDQILEQYMTLDQIKWDTYAGTGLDKTNFMSRMLDADVLAKIYANLSAQFITMVTPFLGSDDHAVRLKLLRQSADKHFAMLPGRFIKNAPFIEPMDVPKDQSKVAFSKYEIEKGLDNGTPVAREAAASEDTSTSGDTSVFGAR